MNLQTIVRQGFAKRLFLAHAALEAEEGVRLSRQDIADRIGKLLGGGGPDQSTVASWFNREIIPAPELGIVVALVYRVSPGWLYFDEGVMKSGHHPPAKPMPPGERIGAKGSRKKVR